MLTPTGDRKSKLRQVECRGGGASMEDIVIIGGGLAGSSLGWSLAERGHRPLILESTTIGGGGATAHSRGMVRLYDDEPRLVALNRDGIGLWADVEVSRPGIFRRPGMIYAPAPSNRSRIEEFARMESRAAYPAETIDGPTISGLCGLLGDHFRRSARSVLWEPLAGYVDPRAGARFFADEAVRLGASLVEGCTVVDLYPACDHVVLTTGAGRITARRVILASGADTLRLQQPEGLFARSINLTSFIDDIAGAPEICLIDEVSKGYIRPGCRRSYFVGGAIQKDATVPEELKVDNAAADAQNLALSRRILRTRSNSAIASHPGYDAYTSDFLPLIRLPPEEGGAGLFTGFSGRGAKYIPAMARRFAASLSGGVG
ncbi:FAD dependent oxidoreductase [Saliniramus fredricksonii]|uniref:FAD dependent oxidoreductase n=2 Tax=Saliniramus fredricksonii TaxID=1653334 RepID=A0ABY0K3H6_9HYPH|nr:FAD dependent oxidoreductase [Saliniramus fredricksonii]